MIFDAKGNPVGESGNDYKCRVAGEDIVYKVLPKSEMHENMPYAVSKVEFFPFTHLHEGRPRKVVVLKNYEIQVEQNIPERIRPIFALHEHLHKKNYTHKEIFSHELAAARELGVQDDYVRFMSRDDVFRDVRELHEYDSEDGRAMSYIRDALGAEAWMKLEGNDIVDL